MTYLQALAHVTQRGYYPICIIDFEKKEMTVYTPDGQQVVPFDDVTNINISCNIPFLIMPN